MNSSFCKFFRFCVLAFLVIFPQSFLYAENMSVDAISGSTETTSCITKKTTIDKSNFLDLKFGMFIHFNMATYENVQWVSGYPSPAKFNPGVKKIDTDAWADAAVAAGMKYAVLTVKHVGGFCLWDSKYTTYDIKHPDCPYQKDLVAQFIKSFKKKGLKVGLYYCWRHPGFASKYKVLPPECDPATHSLEEQIEFQKKQIAELVEKYPDVFYIWNDALDPDLIAAEKIKPFFEKECNGILTSSNWWSWPKKGFPFMDVAITEVRHFKESHKMALRETCWELEKSWFWNGESAPKTAENIMEQMKRAHANKANFLLNVGPNTKGEFQESSVEVLKKIGELLKKGE